MLAIEQHNPGSASLEMAAEIAGVSLGETIALLSACRVKTNLRKEDYLEGLANLRRI